jgi:predicted transcriptional regulator
MRMSTYLLCRMSRAVLEVWEKVKTQFSPDWAESLLLVLSPEESNLIQQIGKHSKVRAGVLVELVGRSQQHVSAQVSRLKRLGVVAADRDGGAVFYSLRSPELTEYLKRK